MNFMTVVEISVLSTLIVIMGLVLLVPRRTRPDIFFSVTVNAAFRKSAEGIEILRKFNREVALWTGAAMAVGALAFLCGSAPAFALLIAAIVFQIAGVTFAQLRARRKVLAHRVSPSSEREAQLTPNNARPVGGWFGQLGPFLILAAFVIAIGFKWPEIPARFPIHWGADGNPNGWANKTWAGVFLMPMMALAACVLIGALGLGLHRGVRHVHASGEERAKESAFLRRMLTIVLGVEYFLAAFFGGMGCLPLMMSPNHNPLPAAGMIISATLPLFAISAAVILVAKSGQGGSYLSRPKNPDAAPVGDRTPDECWKGGLFYNNPNDPALFVEKRFGIGWTLNFGHRRAWLLMGGLLLFVVLCIMAPIAVLK